MTNAWELAKGTAEKHANAGGVFVRLANNGDKVTGVFCGDPCVREVVWTGDKYEIYDKDNPAHQATGKRPSIKVAVNFFVLPEGEMKILEGSRQWFMDLFAVREKYGLEAWSFEIRRHGEAKDTKTKYSILPEEKIDAALRARIAQAELHNLEAVLFGGGAQKESQPDAAIGESDAVAIVGRLKALPRDDVNSILGELGVQRVRDLRASELAHALGILAQYENGQGDEVDPFS